MEIRIGYDAYARRGSIVEKLLEHAKLITGIGVGYNGHDYIIEGEFDLICKLLNDFNKKKFPDDYLDDEDGRISKTQKYYRDKYNIAKDDLDSVSALSKAVDKTRLKQSNLLKGSLIDNFIKILNRYGMLEHSYMIGDYFKYKTKDVTPELHNNMLGKFIQENAYKYMKEGPNNICIEKDGEDILENMDELSKTYGGINMKVDDVKHITNSGVMRMKRVTSLKYIHKNIKQFFEHDNQAWYYINVAFEGVPMVIHYGTDNREIVSVSANNNMAVAKLRDGDTFDLWKGVYVCVVKLAKDRMAYEQKLLKKATKEQEAKKCQKANK